MQSLQWSIPDFPEILKNATRKLQLEHNEPDKHKFSIMMRFVGRQKDCIEIYYKSPVSISLLFELHANQRQQFTISKMTEGHLIKAGQWQYICTITLKQILSCIIFDSLHLNFLYKIIDIDNNTSGKRTTENSNYLKQFISNGQFSDIITIKSAEGKVYKVHKEMLAIRSPVVKAQFEHNTIECQTNTIESHLENEVLDEIILFIYSNKTSSDKDMCMKLLAAADFYQISQLKSSCETVLYENLTSENALDILVHADMYSAETLKQLTLEFITLEPNIVIKDEVWAKLKSVELLKALCKSLLDTNVLCYGPAKS